MPTFLLYAHYPINVRNILRCGVLDELLASAPDVRVVIVSPLAADPRFAREFASDRVVIEHRPEYRLGLLQRRFDQMAIERFVRLHPTRALQLRWQRRENVATRRYRSIAWLTKVATGRLPLSPGMLLGWVDALVRRDSYEPILRHQPDVVAVASGWHPGELPWYVGARRLGIPCLAIDLNWDSFESKAGIIRSGEELLVWSEALRAKAMARFGYRPDRVHVTGAPQFDWYFHRRLVSTREEFLARLGFPPQTKLIMLAAVVNSPHDPDRLDVLYRALRAGEFGPEARILVRLHPADSLRRWERLGGLPRLRIEPAFGPPPSGGSPQLGESRSDLKHKVESLLYTDVMVNVNSTIAFEAMLVDCPVVTVAFDGQGGTLPYFKSDARFLDYEHLRELVDTGGFRVTRTPEEFVAAVRRYLDEPEFDSDARANAARLLYGWRDGDSAKRVAARLLDAAERRRRAA